MQLKPYSKQLHTDLFFKLRSIWNKNVDVWIRWLATQTWISFSKIKAKPEVSTCLRRASVSTVSIHCIVERTNSKGRNMLQYRCYWFPSPTCLICSHAPTKSHGSKCWRHNICRLLHVLIRRRKKNHILYRDIYEYRHRWLWFLLFLLWSLCSSLAQEICVCTVSAKHLHMTPSAPTHSGDLWR